jgi:hypothetical protein
MYSALCGEIFDGSAAHAGNVTEFARAHAVMLAERP